MPTVGGTAAAHAGAPGSDEIAATKEILGLDPAKNFALPDGLLVHAQQVADRGADLQRSWDAEVAEWRAASPDAGALLNRLIERDATPALAALAQMRSEEHTSELQSRGHLVCRLLLEKTQRNYG